MWFIGLLLLAVAGGLFYGYRSKLKRLGLVVSTDVQTVEHLRELASSMADGFGSGALRFPAAVNGKVRCAEPLTSELTQTDARLQVSRGSRPSRPRGLRARRGHRSRRSAQDRRSGG